MFDLNDMKRLGGKIVCQSKLNESFKKQLFNYLREADTHQMMAFLLDGQAVFGLDPNSRKLLEKRFFNSNLPDLVISSQLDFIE